MVTAASSIVIRELLIYPIKSCASIKVDEAQTTPHGLALPSNLLLSNLQVDAPGMPTLVISYSSLPMDIIEIEKLNVKGQRYNINTSNWFREFLETPELALVYFDQEFEPQYVRNIEPNIPNGSLDSDTILYHYMSPYHLCSIESTEDLNKRLEELIEDYWRLMQIGDTAKLRWFRLYLRCLLPTVTQETGVHNSDKVSSVSVITLKFYTKGENLSVHKTRRNAVTLNNSLQNQNRDPKLVRNVMIIISIGVITGLPNIILSTYSNIILYYAHLVCQTFSVTLAIACNILLDREIRKIIQTYFQRRKMQVLPIRTIN
ncbi:hypothetical protein I4U23_022502 [Adineta vaga]|nr:hypothetical protein I4U23_022502 [Adineta vaga]